MYQEIFNNLMKLIRPFMKTQGFTSRGNNFYKRHPQGNIGIINLQKNREGFPKFTINVGIYSVVLAKYFLAEFNQKTVKEHPSLGDYHWEERIGFLVPEQNVYRKKDQEWRNGSDKWWWYDDTIDVDQLFNELKQLIIEFGIPEIDKHITDEQLKAAWFATTNSGDGGPDCLKYLCILFKHYGEKEKLSLVLNDFEKFMKTHPEITGLKKHYDRFMKEADFDTTGKLNTLEKLNVISGKRKISKEEILTADNNPKKMKP